MTATDAIPQNEPSEVLGSPGAGSTRRIATLADGTPAVFQMTDGRTVTIPVPPGGFRRHLRAADTGSEPVQLEGTPGMRQARDGMRAEWDALVVEHCSEEAARSALEDIQAVRS